MFAPAWFERPQDKFCVENLVAHEERLSNEQIEELVTDIYTAPKRSEQRTAARNRLMAGFYRAVCKLAYKWHRRTGADLGDMVQGGCLGLIRAAEAYNPTLGQAKFLTYAYHGINHGCRKASEIFFSTYGSACFLAHQRKLAVAEARFYAAMGRWPSVVELSELTGINEESVRHALKMRDLRFISEFRQDPPTPQAKEPEERDDDGVIGHIQRFLIERDREVIERRFGLNGFDPHTLEEIGVALGVTKERVRQLEVRALTRLRSVVKDKTTISTGKVA